MSKYQSVRGTRDLLPSLKKKFRQIDEIAYQTALAYGYGEIETPLFEFSEIFHRSLGETSDAVSKETYTFVDRGGDSLTLRPEGTAGVVRAFISEGLAQQLPLKLYYFGPMFRYERPQRGRYRQFQQFGVEVLGLESPLADVECIDLAWTILGKLQLHQRCQLEINTLGDIESRQRYRQALVDYLTPFRAELSSDSQVRLEKNPLRILDSKDEADRRLLVDAPRMQDFLNQQSKDFFQQVLQGLQALKIPYHINPKLVRGLDYYCHTVFEFTTTELGAQSALLSGGRYDGLVELLGGPKTSGVGFGAGVDRLADVCSNYLESIEQKTKPVSIVGLGELATQQSLALASELRQKQIYCEVFLSGNFKKKLEKANRLQTEYALMIFQQENGDMEYKVKNFATGDEKIHTRESALQEIEALANNRLLK